MDSVNRQKILAQYCEDNVLDIPNGLFNMRDVIPMLFNNNSSIFYKDLEMDLLNIEFYTRLPCIVYIESGKEVITTSDNRSFEISSGEAILLPKGLNLYSDYTHEGMGLKAYLVFFGPEVLSRFLSSKQTSTLPIYNEAAIYKICIDRIIKEYFPSLQSAYQYLNNSPHLLQLKLLELLHLLDLYDDGS
jgi:hypothetical protein